MLFRFLRMSPLFLFPAVAAPTDAALAQPAAKTPSEARAFLDELKRAAPPPAAPFDVRRARSVDADRILSHVSHGGVSFADVDGRAVGHVSLQKLGSDVRKHRGRYYRALLHLGYIASRPEARYSAVSVQSGSDYVRVSVGDWYAIVLRDGGNGLRVTGIEKTHTGEK